MRFSKSWISFASLFLLILLSYAPFIGFRFLRMAGDDKVYVAQALEMAHAGEWFRQTLFDVPNYYKGPFHYWMLRLGILIFGEHSMWATLYMNLLFCLVGAGALFVLGRRRFPDKPEAGFVLGAWFALNIGIYTHSFASQMEVALAAFFAVALLVLDQFRGMRGQFAFWMLAGAAGWIKSPLHSVLLGCGALLFWLWQGTLLQKLRSLRSWGAFMSGVLFCLLGYAPAFFLDRENWLSSYVFRETLHKSASGLPPTIAIESTFGFYLFPWVLVAFVCYLFLGTRIFRLFKLSSKIRELLALAFSVFIPSAVFFAWHPYRFENYTLPVISAVVLMMTALLYSMDKNWTRVIRLAVGLTGIVFLSLAVCFSAMIYYLSPLPNWWPPVFNYLGPLGILITALATLYFSLSQKWFRLDYIFLAILPFYLSVGGLLSILGEREMQDLHAFVKRNPAVVQKAMGYYNLHQNIWSEWGYLGFMAGYRVEGLHTEDRFLEAVDERQLILIPGRQYLDEAQALLKTKRPTVNLTAHPWRRWYTRGRDENGNPLWKKAIQERNLDWMTREFYLVTAGS